MSQTFDYATAFARNLGLINPQEQERLRRSCVAVAGLGGVGGIHLITLARMGVGRFRIADLDTFELANFNRQAGALMSTLDRPKVEVMRAQALDINPEAEIDVYAEGVTADNVGAFLDGVDVALDGLDFTAVEARALFYAEAYRRGIPVVAVGPVGASAASLVFMPGGMTWQEYFALDLAKNDFERYLLFILGTAPAALHMPYIDRRYVDLANKRGPSLALAVQLCAGVAAAEVMKLLLKRGRVRAAPWYQQYDAYRGRLAVGYLAFGNRNPLQRLKFLVARRLLAPPPVSGSATG